MKRKKMIILPKLNDAGGDLSKKWFVYFSVCDPRNDKMQRFKEYDGLSGRDETTRREAAIEKIKTLTQKLKNGWTPFIDDGEAIYEDQLQYRTIADIYGKQRVANTTFRLYASKYIGDLKKKSKNIEEKTIATYASKLRIFAEWLVAKHGEIDISMLDNKIVLQFFYYLVDDKKLASGTVNDYRQIISAVFDYAKNNGNIAENPVYNIPAGTEKDFAPRPILEFDIEIFRNFITERDKQLWMAIEFETYCFLRPGKELRLLKIKDIDFARGLINVDRFRAKTNRERFATTPKHFLLKLRNEYKLQGYAGDFYVFGENGEPGKNCLGKNNLKNRFNRFRKELNMPETYKFYSWKHTGNSLALDNDISMYALRNQNGHSSVQITEIYTQNKLGKVSKEIQDRFPNLDNI